MIEIAPLRPEQAVEARRVIYAVAHALFMPELTFEEAAAKLEREWPIVDVLNFQSSYMEKGGVFLAAFDDGRLIGTGGLRRLEDGVGEIKRLWLLPAYHGLGVGHALMERLLEAAREQGYTCVRLETSPAYQKRAYRFYRRLGFVEIPRYGDDPDDVGMELMLA